MRVWPRSRRALHRSDLRRVRRHGGSCNRLRGSRTVNGDRAMGSKQLKHVNRELTEEERARHAQIRAAAEQEIPPKPGTGRNPPAPGIPAKIRQAREAQGLSWYALAKSAKIPNSATIRDIEQGKDVKLSDL